MLTCSDLLTLPAVFRLLNRTGASYSPVCCTDTGAVLTHIHTPIYLSYWAGEGLWWVAYFFLQRTGKECTHRVTLSRLTCDPGRQVIPPVAAVVASGGGGGGSAGSKFEVVCGDKAATTTWLDTQRELITERESISPPDVFRSGFAPDGRKPHTCPLLVLL